jgi:hypothetical protein
MFDTEVLTSDGHVLGTVKEARDDCFKLNVPGKFDEWLPDHTIKELHEDMIIVSFAYGDLFRFQIDDFTPRGVPL